MLNFPFISKLVNLKKKSCRIFLPFSGFWTEWIEFEFFLPFSGFWNDWKSMLKFSFHVQASRFNKISVEYYLWIGKNQCWNFNAIFEHLIGVKINVNCSCLFTSNVIVICPNILIKGSHLASELCSFERWFESGLISGLINRLIGFSILMHLNVY